MRFRYPMQKIVDLKANETSQAEWLLSQAVSELSVCEERVQQLLAEIEAVQSRLDGSRERMSISDMLTIQSYVEHLQLQLQRRRRDVQRAADEVEYRRSLLRDKMLDEKVWLNAKEKAFVQFSSEMLKKEQELLDEMATVRHSRAFGM